MPVTVITAAVNQKFPSSAMNSPAAAAAARRRAGDHLVVDEPVLVPPRRPPRRVVLAGAAGARQHGAVEQPVPERARREASAGAGAGHRGGGHDDGLEEVHGHLPRVPLRRAHQGEVEVGARRDAPVVQPARLPLLRQQRRPLQRRLRAVEPARVGAGGERVRGVAERGEDVAVAVVVRGAAGAGRVEQGQAAGARGEERVTVGEEGADVVVEEGNEGADGGVRRHRHCRRRRRHRDARRRAFFLFLASAYER
ncbi:hypothetical protein DAI22_05g133601 [Oryza sativa Japonica Group]|nr:hypothetical protein DAI22_05g133601 [Oryza sativa Japonica Group]